MSLTGKPLYLMAANASMQLDADSLLIHQTGKSDHRIPLERIGRAVIKHQIDDQLQACLAIIRQGGTVHFTDANGHICAMLQQPHADGTSWARELARSIEMHPNNAPFSSWRTIQQQHAYSLVFRHAYCGDFASNRARLLRYLNFFRPQLNIQHETQWLQEQLLAWLQAAIATEGLFPVVRALHTQGVRLIDTLQPCLFIPLLWAYVRWRRQKPTALVANRTAFFELQAAAPMQKQFNRHIQALAYQYHSANSLAASLAGHKAKP